MAGKEVRGDYFKFSFKSKLLQNIVSLSFLQVVNNLLPLITFPYLVRVLGPEKFGLVNFAAAFVGYFSLITDYGFNLSATREISINRENKNKVNEIVNAVLAVKIILFICSFIIFEIILFTFRKFNEDHTIYLISFLNVFGALITPLWFFLGYEKMKLFAVPTIIVKLLIIVLIFLLIKSTGDYHLYVWMTGLGTITVGIVTLTLLRFIFKVEFFLPSKAAILYQLKEGGIIFISTFSISLYTLSNPFILGLFAPLNVVGYYSVADKVLQTIKSIFSPITQSLYPLIARISNDSFEQGVVYINKSLFYFGASGFLISVLLFSNSETILHFFFGNAFTESIKILKILSIVPFVFSIAVVTSNLFLLGFGFNKIWAKLYMYVSMLSVLLAIILIKIFQDPAIAISTNVVFIEFLGMFFSYVLYIKLKNNSKHKT